MSERIKGCKRRGVMREGVIEHTHTHTHPVSHTHITHTHAHIQTHTHPVSHTHTHTHTPTHIDSRAQQYIENINIFNAAILYKI